MGCDVHMRAEVRKDGKWTAVKAAFPSVYGGPVAAPYDGRNYDLFAILANVRNGYGFAGCVTGSGFKPISDPRGLPADVDREGHGEWWPGDHSFTWVGLDELLAYDWEQTAVKSGWISLRERLLMSTRTERGSDTKPQEWCGGIDGGLVQHVSLAKMDRMIADADPADLLAVMRSKQPKDESLVHAYAEISWKATYGQCAGKHWNEVTMPLLRTLGEPEDVRLVMGFDS